MKDKEKQELGDFISGCANRQSFTIQDMNHIISLLPTVKLRKNPFVGYIDVVENIRMAKEQGYDRAIDLIKNDPDNEGIKFVEL